MLAREDLPQQCCRCQRLDLKTLDFQTSDLQALDLRALNLQVLDFQTLDFQTFAANGPVPPLKCAMHPGSDHCYWVPEVDLHLKASKSLSLGPGFVFSANFQLPAVTSATTVGSAHYFVAKRHLPLRTSQSNPNHCLVGLKAGANLGEVHLVDLKSRELVILEWVQAQLGFSATNL